MILALGDSTPDLDPTTWVAPNATVIGRVKTGENVGIWYNAVIRADFEAISLGANTNVQDGAVIHADPGFATTVGTGVSIGHNAILHGCTVGDDVLIGMGATVLNGAVVGAGSLVAANALITQGMQIPPGSLVAGVPEKVRTRLYDTPHEFNAEMQAEAWDWLRKWI